MTTLAGHQRTGEHAFARSGNGCPVGLLATNSFALAGLSLVAKTVQKCRNFAKALPTGALMNPVDVELICPAEETRTCDATPFGRSAQITWRINSIRVQRCPSWSTHRCDEHESKKTSGTRAKRNIPSSHWNWADRGQVFGDYRLTSHW